MHTSPGSLNSLRKALRASTNVFSRMSNSFTYSSRTYCFHNAPKDNTHREQTDPQESEQAGIRNGAGGVNHGLMLGPVVQHRAQKAQDREEGPIGPKANQQHSPDQYSACTCALKGYLSAGPLLRYSPSMLLSSRRVPFKKAAVAAAVFGVGISPNSCKFHDKKHE